MWTEKDMIGRIREEPKKEEKKEEQERTIEEVIDEIVETVKQMAEETVEEPSEETVTEIVEEKIEKIEEEPVETAEEKTEERIHVPSPNEEVREITRHVAPTIVKEERNEKTEAEIMPCPFCGATVKLTFYKKWHVTGHETSCILAPSFNTGKTKEQMLAAWNRRV